MTRFFFADPVKVLRPAPPQQQVPAAQGAPDQLKRLEAELSARAQEALTAKEEAARTGRGLQALTVVVHHLTEEVSGLTPRLQRRPVVKRGRSGCWPSFSDGRSLSEVGLVSDILFSDSEGWPIVVACKGLLSIRLVT